MDGLLNGQTDRWKRQKRLRSTPIGFYLDGQNDRRMDGQMDRQTDRQRDRWTGRWTKGQKDRLTVGQKYGGT